MKHLLFLILIIFFTQIQAQQPGKKPVTSSSNSNQLLWYSGKKVNDSTLITANGSKVLYSKKRNVVIVQPDPNKDPSKKIIRELAKNEQLKKGIVTKFSETKSSVMLYPSILNALNELDRIFKFFNQLLNNTIKLPPLLTAGTTKAKTNFATGGSASIHKEYNLWFPIPDAIKKAYNEVMADMKNYPSIDFPAPPAKEFGTCYNCDTTAANIQDSVANNWNIEFIKYEAGLIQQSIGIFQKLEQLKLNTDPEAIQIKAGLDKAMEFAVARVDNKVDLLIRKYGKDFTRLPLVLKAAITHERQKQLQGIGKDTYATTMQKLLTLFDGFEEYLEQQMDARNYDVILNMAFIIGTERQKQLLGASEENRIPVLIDRINAFNRFKVNMELDYNSSWSGECGTSTDDAKAVMEEDFYVSMGFVNCKYGLYMAEQHLQKITNYHPSRHTTLELKMIKGTMIEKAKNDFDKCVTETRNTAGDKVRPYLPLAKISFCENGESDSLIMPGLNRRMAEKYGESKLYENITLLFSDNPEPKLSEVVDPGNEINQINKLSQEYEMSAQTRKPGFSEMENMHAITAKKEHLTNNILQAADAKKQSYILFNASNADETLIDAETTFTYKDDEDEAFVGGKRNVEINVKYKVIHDPLPYKSGTKKK